MASCTICDERRPLPEHTLCQRCFDLTDILRSDARIARIILMNLGGAATSRGKFWTGSIVSAQDGKAKVQISWAGIDLQVASEQARELGLRIIEAAEAADMDEMVVAFLIAEGMTLPKAAGVLARFRAMRRSKEKPDG